MQVVEKAMATHSSTLAWKIPWMEEPGGLQSMGLHRVGHNWATKHTHTQCLTGPILKVLIRRGEFYFVYPVFKFVL